MAASLVGRRLPLDATLWVLKQAAGEHPSPVPVKLGDLIGGKRVVLFAVPGPFTPGCTRSHAPGFLKSAQDLRVKGIQGVYCVSASDVFVMKAWSESIGNTKEQITMLSDGNLEFTRALGLVLDATAKGMGLRSKRYAMIVGPDGTVEHCGVDEGKIEKSSANAILSRL